MCRLPLLSLFSRIIKNRPNGDPTDRLPVCPLLLHLDRLQCIPLLRGGHLMVPLHLPHLPPHLHVQAAGSTPLHQLDAGGVFPLRLGLRPDLHRLHHRSSEELQHLRSRGRICFWIYCNFPSCDQFMDVVQSLVRCSPNQYCGVTGSQQDSSREST